MTRRIECVPNFSEGRRKESQTDGTTVRDVPGMKRGFLLALQNGCV